MLEKRPASRLSRLVKVVLVFILFAVIAAAIVIWGIDARIKTAAAVRLETQDLAIPTVAVIHPKPGSPQNEIVLPGSIQAFVDAPIYARESGYLKRWYADIGTNVKAGQVLAEIEAPRASTSRSARPKPRWRKRKRHWIRRWPISNRARPTRNWRA